MLTRAPIARATNALGVRKAKDTAHGAEVLTGRKGDVGAGVKPASRRKPARGQRERWERERERGSVLCCSRHLRRMTSTRRRCAGRPRLSSVKQFTRRAAVCIKRTQADQDGKPAAMATENPWPEPVYGFHKFSCSLKHAKNAVQSKGGKAARMNFRLQSTSGHGLGLRPPPSGQLCQDRREGLQTR